MKKVLMAFDDFVEMSTVEAVLKKVGFDVVGITNEVLLADQLLQFNPDVVIAHGKSKRVSSISIGRKLRDHHWFVGKSVLVFSPEAPPDPSELATVKMDVLLTSPVDYHKLTIAIAKLTGLDSDVLIDKLKRATLSGQLSNESFKVTGGNGEVRIEKMNESDHQRVERYKKLLEGFAIDTRQTTFSKMEVRRKQKELKKEWDFDQLEEIDELKRQFAEALFKRK